MARYVVSLESGRALREVWAGGKGASLAWLGRNGFNVPAGFIVTSAAFNDFLAGCGVEVPSQSEDWTQAEAARVREFVTTSDVPDRLVRPVLKAYRQLGGPVAVRSSMVGEDGGMHSFAGQLDTALNVHGERDLLEAVRQCWASVFSWRNLRYLAEREGSEPREGAWFPSMAVVVQRMVDAMAAGVAFSADPVTGRRCVVVEAAPGLGDTLVAGLVQPDRYVVDARAVLEETTLANPEAPALAEHHVLQLAEIVRTIARRLGTPQDVEWAWDGTDFYILQCRPITSLVGQTVYSNKMVSDMAPGLIAPLVFSTKIVGMAENVFGHVFTELLGPNDTDFKLLVARIRSRVYTNITLLGDLFERVGMPPNFFESLSRGELADARRPPVTLKTMRAMSRLGAFAWRHSRIAGEIEAFIERHDQQLDRYRSADWSGKDPQRLLAAFNQLMDLHGELQWYIFIGPTNMMVRNRLLNRLVERRVKDAAGSDLIRGLVGLKALEPNEELRRLAVKAQALEDGMQRSLIRGEDRGIRRMLSASQKGRELVRGVDAFLVRYGFLSPNGTDFAATPWVERPTLIWRAIGRYATSPPQISVEDMEARRDAARERIRSELGGLHRLVFDRLLASTITYIDLRERTSFLMSEDSFHMRRIIMALADHFVARGDLDRREDVFYLFYPEVRRLVEGELDGDTARALVRGRIMEMEADAEVELPSTICGDRVPSRPIRPLEGQGFLVGISGSSGVAQGHARIIRDPAEVPRALTREDILVVPFTDVGWTPLFPGVGGIVAETGGQLSHTSIVAREYGLPAVVSVKHATHLLKEGQAITIDGDAGRVYLKHPAKTSREEVR
jgi:pyruvate,water dikinase